MEQHIALEELIAYIKSHCIKSVSTQLSETQQEPLTPTMTYEQEIINHYFGDDTNIKYCKVIDTIPDTQNNISWCSSILSCILENFDQFDNNDKIICITKFFSKLLMEIRKRNGLNRFITPTLMWDKKELCKNLNSYNFSQDIVAYIATYMNINIFIISSEEIIVYCIGRLFNTHKQSIVILQNDNVYSPLSCNNKRIWTYQNNDTFQKLLSNNSKHIHIYQQNKTTQPLEIKLGYDNDIELVWTNIDKQLNEEEKNKSSDNSNKKIIEKVEFKKYTREELSAMKCLELRQLAQTRDIKISLKDDGKTRPKNKEELIKDLL